MQLICPNCGEPISSEHINIQRMVAVCSHCHTVFQFDPSDSKIKRRKVKRPQHFTLDERDGRVDMAFRTNFRLDKNEAFLSSAGLSAFFTFLTAGLFVNYFANQESALMVAGFAVVTLLLYYRLALVAYNKTHIEISDESIEVSRKPLPNLLRQPNTISLSGIEKIRYEETPASKQESYDTPRYNVWAEAVDGHRKLIVGDVVEDYAVFISQQLNEMLGLGASPDVSRLQGDESEADNGQIPDEAITRSESSRT